MSEIVLKRLYDLPGEYRAADSKLAVIPRRRLVVADSQKITHMADKPFFILANLLANTDEVVHYELFTKWFYGATGFTETKGVLFHLREAQDMIGPKLGDPYTGAIRRMQGLGLMAVSSLKSEIGFKRPN